MLPGDVILYSHKNPLSLAISLKTWHPISHVAIYIGNWQTVEARLGGVNFYPLETDGIVGIYRPAQKFDFQAGQDWFVKVAMGQKYDWLGVFGFLFQNEGSKHKMFCSEFATRWFRKAGLDLFPGEDADKVAPFQFAVNPLLSEVYQEWKKESPSKP